MKTIKSTIKARIKESGDTVAAVARRAKMERSALSRYLNDHDRKVQSDVLERLLRALRLELRPKD